MLLEKKKTKVHVSEKYLGGLAKRLKEGDGPFSFGYGHLSDGHGASNQRSREVNLAQTNTIL